MMSEFSIVYPKAIMNGFEIKINNSNENMSKNKSLLFIDWIKIWEIFKHVLLLLPICRKKFSSFGSVS